MPKGRLPPGMSWSWSHCGISRYPSAGAALPVSSWAAASSGTTPPAIVEKMHDADVIVFASPIYYYEMSGQMKTLLDRANSLFDSDYAFKEVYLLTSAAEDEEQVPERAISGLSGWVECFPRASLAGTVFAGGLNDEGEIAGHPALKKAYDMGAGIV